MAGRLDPENEDKPCYVTLKIGIRWYLVAPLSVASVERADLSPSKRAYIPSTVLYDYDGNDVFGNIEKITRDFERCDDVWSRQFLDVRLVSKSIRIADPNGTSTGKTLHLRCDGEPPPQGPYVIQQSTGEVFAVSKLYPDTHKAFCYGVVKSPGFEETFEPLSLFNHIAVPSRLYFQKSKEKPLAGNRFAVKDLIDVAGCRTGCGNAAWSSLYPPATSHADVVQQLLDAGAVLVGKAKTAQFAEGVDPLQWVDYQCPFNPRGDGYQHPSGSSAGSAAAVAGYEWLDFALGTDTGGSIRAPAGINGIYGTRPSTALTNTSGVFSVTPYLDTIGVFARHVSTLRDASLKTIRSPLPIPNLDSYRYKLLYPVRSTDSPSGTYRWFPYPGKHGDAVAAENEMESFVQSLEAYLECQRYVFNLDEAWEKTRPKDQSPSLDEATGMIYSIITTYTQATENMPKFFSDYAEQNDGREPFIDPVVRDRQEFGRSQSKESFDAAVQAKEMFSKWVNDFLLATEVDGKIIPILIFPQSFGRPNYRHVDSKPKLFWDTFSIYSFGYLCGCPDYTVPIAEVPFLSSVTQKEEFLPVSISIVGRPGHDVILFNILSGLAERRVLKEVRAGRRMFLES